MGQENRSRHVVLSSIAPFDRTSDDLKIVIETPKGSRNKYKYEPDFDCLELSTVRPEGMVFPFDFGFIPSTVGADGDRLDVLVLMDAPVVPGCVIRGRLLGPIKARQRDKEQNEWMRNDRLIAVARHAQTHRDAKSVKDLRTHLPEEISAFFVDYNQTRGREFEQLDLCGPHKAMKIIEDGIVAYKQTRTSGKNGKRTRAGHGAE
jgi:inorganic pyrophosphatase